MHRNLIPAVAIALAALLSACGGGSSEDDAADAATQADWDNGCPQPYATPEGKKKTPGYVCRAQSL